MLTKRLSLINPRPLSPDQSPAGDNLRMAFTLNQWGTQSRAFEVRATPTTTTTMPYNSTTPANTTTSTQPTPMVTDDESSIFDAASTVPAGAACILLALLFLVTVQ